MSRRILITGGAGFIGSNYLNYKSKFQDIKIVNLDKLTYAANVDNLQIANDCDYTFIKGDICDPDLGIN